MKQNRFGICEWCMPTEGPEAILQAGRLGFDGIQITERGGYEAGHPLLDADLQQKYRDASREAGVKLQALHLHALCRMANMIHPPEGEAGQIAAQCVQAGLHICRELKISALMLTSGFLCSIKNEEDFKIFGEHLHRACEAAAPLGVQIVFESALTAAEIQRMIREVGGGLMACYDVFNPLRFHLAVPEQEITALGAGAIHHFHLKDGPPNMVGCSLLGQGCGGFARMASAVKQIDFTGWFVTENYYCADPLAAQGGFEELARRDLATMRQTFGG